MNIYHISMTAKRFRPNMIHIYLHPEEDKFIKDYAETNFLTVSELIRGWIHETMNQKGLLLKNQHYPKF